MFLVELVVIAVLIQLGITLGFSLLKYGVLITLLLFSALLIRLRPYEDCIDNLGAILSSITGTLFCLVPILHSLTNISESNEVLLIFCLQGLLVFSSLFALIRISKNGWYHLKSCLFR